MTSDGIKLTIDNEVASDFRDSFIDNYDSIANSVIKLEQDPTDSNTIDEIFRCLHTIKGNASMCQLDTLTVYTHAIEEVVSSMRTEKLTFTQIIGEMLLLALDKVKEVSEALFADKTIDTELLSSVEGLLQKLKSAQAEDVVFYANQIISSLTGFDSDENNRMIVNHASTIVGKQNTAKKDLDVKQPLASASLEIPNSLTGSLNYFKHLNSLLEVKLPYWQYRIARTLPLALALNDALSHPVLSYQLEAAVLMHDIAFAFLSDSLLLKAAKFDEQEMIQMKTHPQLSANFVELIPGWQNAAHIILQHHEYWDGSGYPYGLQGDQIGVGAQILAIVDAYESMTHPRPDRQYKRSILRAVTEINNCSGKQFSPHITPVFNSAIRQLIAKQA